MRVALPEARSHGLSMVVSNSPPTADLNTPAATLSAFANVDFSGASGVIFDAFGFSSFLISV
jgi:hypothetical protein